MSLIRLVLFDMDGVLADTEPVHLDATNRALSPFGVELTEAEVAGFLGQTDEALFRTLAERHGLDSDVSRLVKAKATHFFERVVSGPLVANPGVPELLLHLKMRGVDAVVASSSSPDVIDVVVGRLGLRRAFSRLFSAAMVERGKPAPDLFLHAATELDVPPSDCLVIEDAPAGVEAARAAGMRVIAVRTPMTAGLDLSGADQVLPSLTEFDMEMLEDG